MTRDEAYLSRGLELNIERFSRNPPIPCQGIYSLSEGGAALIWAARAIVGWLKAKEGKQIARVARIESWFEYSRPIDGLAHARFGKLTLVVQDGTKRRYVDVMVGARAGRHVQLTITGGSGSALYLKEDGVSYRYDEGVFGWRIDVLPTHSEFDCGKGI